MSTDDAPRSSSAIADYKPTIDPTSVAPFGPALIEKRTSRTALTKLGTSFMEFTETGISEPWTLLYEETIYVIVGHTDIEIITEGGVPTNIAGDPGDLLVLPEGTTVRYGGTEGTRLLLSITPVDWRDHL